MRPGVRDQLSYIDLHVHSTASDGSLSPEEIVAIAAEKGLSAVAIADHDSVEACGAAIYLGDDLGVKVIPAVEMSCEFNGRDLHVLGYFVDLKDVGLRRFLLRMRELRVERVVRSLEKLGQAGVTLAGADSLVAQAPERSLGRGLLARQLIKEGYAGNMREAFTKYLAAGSVGEVDRGLPAPEEVVSKLRAHGAVVVLAHPGVSRLDHALEHFVELGVQGLEAYHPDHTGEEIKRYLTISKKLGLVATGGSDCHGDHSDRGVMLGRYQVPDRLLGPLEALAART